MDISKREKELFTKWEAKRPKFIPDGIVDEKNYFGCNVKVLYILKEVNGGKGWSLKAHLLKGDEWRTWNNITRWQYAIENNIEIKSFNEISYVSKETRKHYLKNIAVINLKKEPGGASSKMNQVWTYSWEDRDLLKEQIKLYNPDVIVCGGTGEIVKKYSLITKFKHWSTATNGVNYCKNSDNIIIDYCHPQKRGMKKEDAFKKILDVIKELM